MNLQKPGYGLGLAHSSRHEACYIFPMQLEPSPRTVACSFHIPPPAVEQSGSLITKCYEPQNFGVSPSERYHCIQRLRARQVKLYIHETKEQDIS